MRLLNTEQQGIIVALTNAGVPQTGLIVSLAMYKASDKSDITPVDPKMYSIADGLYQLSAARIPSVTDDVIVWKIDGSGTLDDADRYKFGALVFGGELEDRLDSIDSALMSIASTVATINSNLPTGSGSVTGIDHDYGGTDNLRLIDGNGAAIDQAEIHIFSKDDWDNNLRTSVYRKAMSYTDINGRWTDSVCLDPGNYVIAAKRPGATQVDETEFTVT